MLQKKSNGKSALKVLLTIVFSAGFAGATYIKNPGFESQTLANGHFVPTIADWTISGSVGVWNPGESKFHGIPEGENVAYSNGGYFSQVTGVPLVGGYTYNLWVDIGSRTDYKFEPYSIQFFSGTSLLAETGSIIPPAGEFQTDFLTYTAKSSDVHLNGNLQVRLRGYGAQTFFDNVHMQVIPEPGSLALLGLGLLGLLFGRKIFQ